MTKVPSNVAETPHREQGSALLLAILVLFVVTALGVSASRTATTELEVAANYESTWRAFYAADGLAHASFNELIDMGRQLGRFPDAGELSAITLPAVSEVAIDNFVLRPTAAVIEAPLSSGYYHGLTAQTRPYEVLLRAATADYPPATVSVTMAAFFDIIPIFQFAVFYEDDLEMLPAPSMTLSGRMHSNADVYLGSDNTLTIDSNVTAAGDAFHRRKDTSTTPGGIVAIRDGLGSNPGMSGLDSADADWVDESLTRWNGNIRTADHGVMRLNMTIADPTNPHKIIEPTYDSDTAEDRTTKLAYAAEMSINILNGQGFDLDGNPIDLSTAIDFDVLFDQREQKPMLVIEIDIAALGLVASYPAGPTVVYIGSFEPGNGIPDWGDDGGALSLDDIGQMLSDWITALPFRALFGSHVRNALRKTADAVSACLEPDVSEAANRVRQAGDQLDQAVRDGQLTAAQADALRDIIAPLASCAGTGGGSPDPWSTSGAWSGYTAPYDGGNTEFAVKIENGSELPDALTVVTANPVYVQGDYNTVNKKAAAVLADAVTILSNGWNDDDFAHSQLDLSSRVASSTTVNAAFMTGGTETLSGAYNGGVENLPRLLEDWSGRALTWRGSLINLWYSTNATGAWTLGSPVYREPARDWEFDTDLLDPSLLPPATPSVYAVRLREWRRH